MNHLGLVDVWTGSEDVLLLLICQVLGLGPVAGPAKLWSWSHDQGRKAVELLLGHLESWVHLLHYCWSG